MTHNKPNLLYVFADQWRRSAVGFNKQEPVQTPTIDEFTENGIVFDHAVSCTPLCSPARASLLTGKYSISTGVYTNCKLDADHMLQPDEICIGDILKSSGYETGYVGKWHLDLPEQNVSSEPVSGARHWDAYTPPGAKRHGFDFWYSYGAYDEHMTPHYWKDTSEMIQVEQWSVEHETDVVLDFLRNRDREKPFAMFVSWNPPHSPFDQVLQKHKDLYENCEIQFNPNVQVDPLMVHTGGFIPGGEDNLKEYMRNYYAAITGIDENFKRLLEELESQGVLENTIVVLTADHGELMGAHGLMAKHTWHEESIGVPFILHWPDRLVPGRSDIVMNTVDIMPTLLGMLGLQVPATVEGSNFAPVIFGGDAPQSANEAYICAYPGTNAAMKAFEAAGIDNKSYGWRGIRTLTHTYVVHKGYEPDYEVLRLLYDLQTDPYQMNPIQIKRAEEHPLAVELEAKLSDWLTKIKDPFVL